MTKKKELTPEELELQADALLAAADEAAAEISEKPAKKGSKKNNTAAEPTPVMTDEEAKRPASFVWTTSRSLHCLLQAG